MGLSLAIAAAERGLVPEGALRRGIRRLVSRRLADEERRSGGDPEAAMAAWIRTMRESPIAIETDAANAQHYEVPAEFFGLCLGRHRKYSGCLWTEGVADLDAAEEAMLGTTAERAALADGQRVLDLGCGWGSMTLWAAARFPNSRLLGVSNSSRQREFVLGEARRRGLRNVEVVTADVNRLEAPGRFDRVVSVEMMEHARNWEALLRRVHGWLEADGRLFVHVFAHRTRAYPFETEGAANWMGRHFFTGGMMPSDDLLPRLDVPFEPEAHWWVDGTHYARTADAWLRNLEAHAGEARGLLARAHGRRGGRRAYHRWRLFFLACSELFAHRGGAEWGVSHRRLRPAAGASP